MAKNQKNWIGNPLGPYKCSSPYVNIQQAFLNSNSEHWNCQYSF